MTLDMSYAAISTETWNHFSDLSADDMANEPCII